MRRGIAVVRQRVFPASKQIVPLVIGGLCLWAIAHRFDANSLSQIGSAILRLRPAQWIMAMLATGLSFWALGRYDVVVHRHLRTGCAPAHAARVGAAAIALGQVMGMGVVTGALVRWRLLPGLSLVETGQLSLTVALSFFAGLAAVFGLTGLFLAPAFVPIVFSSCLILSIFSIMLVAFLHPEIQIFGHKITLPSLPAFFKITALTLLDTAAAALALYVLLPAGLDIGFALLFPVYLAALTAALVTGTPGGVGPFELTTLGLLPQGAAPEIMAGILAFRLIYYALPALIGAWYLYWGEANTTPPIRSGLEPIRDLPQDISRAELGVCLQNGARLLRAGQSRLAIVSTAQTETAMFDPIRGAAVAGLPGLLALARRRNKVALIYKATPRGAATLRRAGMATLHIADEAVIDPQMFHLEGRKFRQLRRKLRQADEAGIKVTRGAALPQAEMARLDAEWQAFNGGARGLSMGQFCPDYLLRHHVYLAWQNDTLVGFASFHSSHHERCLDLMRSAAKAPSGCMHMLVATALSEARADGLSRVSLAAQPCLSTARAALPRLIARRISHHSGATGLAQFKASFAPRYQPLYAHAKSWPALALGLADLSRVINRPNRSQPHNCHEENEFDSSRHI